MQSIVSSVVCLFPIQDQSLQAACGYKGSFHDGQRCRLSCVGSQYDALLCVHWECVQLSNDASVSMHTCCRQQHVGGSEQQATPDPLCCSTGPCQCRGCYTSAAVCYPQGAPSTSLLIAGPAWFTCIQGTSYVLLTPESCLAGKHDCFLEFMFVYSLVIAATIITDVEQGRKSLYKFWGQCSNASCLLFDLSHAAVVCTSNLCSSFTQFSLHLMEMLLMCGHFEALSAMPTAFGVSICVCVLASSHDRFVHVTFVARDSFWAHRLPSSHAMTKALFLVVFPLWLCSIVLIDSFA